MTTRRDGRPSQVRPRPPSSGRPAPVKARPRGQAPGRIAAHRRVDRTRSLALPFRLLFIVAVVALCGGVLIAATGGIGKVAASVGSTFVGFVAELTATPAPSATPSLLADTPVLQEPGEPYTNQPTIDLVGSIPADVVGKSDIRIRVYVAIGEGEPGIVTEVPVGRTEKFIVPGVGLIEGSNAFTTTLIGPTGESERSPVVTYVLDAAPPTIKLSSPEDGAVVNAKSVKLVGQTQPRSELRVRNATTEAVVTGQADANGNFSIILPIGGGSNNIGITAVDPAGNEGQLDFSVRRGSGALVAKLTASAYEFKRSALPEPVTLTVAVVDPDGRPLAGASVTFLLTVPRISPISSAVIETNGDGVATWSTSIPKGADSGAFYATVIVKTTDYGETNDKRDMRIRK